MEGREQADHSVRDTKGQNGQRMGRETRSGLIDVVGHSPDMTEPEQMIESMTMDADGSELGRARHVLSPEKPVQLIDRLGERAAHPRSPPGPRAATRNKEPSEDIKKQCRNETLVG